MGVSRVLSCDYFNTQAFKIVLLMPFDSLKLTLDSRCMCDESYEVNSGVSCTQ